VAGVPPGNVQAYVGAFVPQFVTTADGLIVPPAQILVIALITTVGGFLTVTIRVVVNVPHGFVTASVMV